MIEIRSLYHPLRGPENIMEQSMEKLKELEDDEEY